MPTSCSQNDTLCTIKLCKFKCWVRRYDTIIHSNHDQNVRHNSFRRRSNVSIQVTRDMVMDHRFGLTLAMPG